MNKPRSISPFGTAVLLCNTILTRIIRQSLIDNDTIPPIMKSAINTSKFFVQNKNFLPGLISSILLLLCFIAGFNLYQNLHLPTEDPIESMAPINKVETLPTIASLHLYGDYNINQHEFPETALQLKLQGVLLSSLSTKSRAIIADNSGSSHVYQIGETVAGGAILQAIQRDFVILSYDNQLQYLRLPIPKLRPE